MGANGDRTLREILGPEVADRVADRIQRDLDNGLAEKMAKAVAGALEIIKVINAAPPEERPALRAHVTAEIERLRASSR